MWRSEWEAISQRIRGIVAAAEFFVRSGVSDASNSTNVLIANCQSTAAAILDLENRLPQGPIKDSLGRFRADWRAAAGRRLCGFEGVTAHVTLLASFRAEFDHAASDHEEVVRSRVNRAFVHLQRAIDIDSDFRQKWSNAFEAGEIECEKLGAVHLLWHGIWAFKTSAEGARTDLVLGNPLEVNDAVRKAADGLVLTEWKVVRRGTDPSTKMRDAVRQMQRYSAGILAGFELSSERYAVLVGHDEFTCPTGKDDGLHRCVPVYIHRSAPSRSRRLRAGRERRSA